MRPDFVDDEQGAPLGFHVHSTKVLAKDTKYEQLYRTKDQYDRRKAGPAFNSSTRNPAQGYPAQRGEA